MALTAQPVGAESLKDALSAAYKFNPKLDAARATLRATDEEVARAHAGYRPSISASGDVGVVHSNTEPPSRGDGESHPKGYTIQGVQPVFKGFRVLNGVRVAEATVRAGRETLRLTEQQVLLEAATAYMDVVRDMSILRLRENNVAVLSRELQATRERFAVGEVTRTDVAQAEARRAGAVSALELARSNLRTSRASFERVIGHPPGNLAEQPLPEKFLPHSQGEAISISHKENPAVGVALYREQAARHQVDLIWGELLPTAQLEAQYTHRYDPSRAVDQSESASVIGRLNVPIYQGGEVQARVRQAKQTHLARLQEIEQARTETTAAVVQAWSRLVAARAQLQSDQLQVTATQTALNGVREEERVGQRTVLDVLNSEQEALNAQVTLQTTKRDLIVAAYNMIFAVGRLNASDLVLSTLVYDPEAHYFEVRRKWFGVNITHADGRSEAHDFWHLFRDRPEYRDHQPVK